ncbi:MAG TPA: hypothetical protein VH120_01215, partial [Gemmataceae bacterium]|nr:hypothetical protein [Gemmataceae bacterium]
AEGISMAMQSSWLLTKRLIAVGRNHVDWNEVSVDYVRAWRRAFTLRLRMAAVIAHWAMRPAALVATLPIVEMFPMILGLGARLSGKASHVLR